MKIKYLTTAIALCVAVPASAADLFVYARLRHAAVPNATNATHLWASQAQTNTALRARLGVPLAVEPAFDLPGLSSRWLPSGQNHPLRKLGRIVRIRYPLVTDPELIRQRLSAQPEFERVYPFPKKYAFTAVSVTDPYLNPTSVPGASENGWCSGITGSACLPKNPFAAPGLPTLTNPDGVSVSQSGSYRQWGVLQVKAPEAWALIGSATTDSNPSNGFYGTANVAVVDWGIARGCDLFNEISCTGAPKYHPDLHANVRENLSVGFDNITADGTQPLHARGFNDAREFLDGIDRISYSVPTQGRLEGGINSSLNPSPTWLRFNAFNATLLEVGDTAKSGHGTHVSGIIASRINNQGTVGVCPTCSLAMYRSDTNERRLSDMIEQAIRHGAQAVNMSFTDEVIIPPGNEEIESVSLIEAVLDVAGSREAWLVGSAGNHRNAFLSGPAAHPNVIAAGGNDIAGKFWDEFTLESNPPPGNPPTSRCAGQSVVECGSNYPGLKDTATRARYLVAPAARILSTMYTTWIGRLPISGTAFGLGACTHELFPAGATNGASATGKAFNSRYGMCTGTSMSAPFITAAGALLRSVNPLLSRDSTLDALMSTGVNVTAPMGGAPFKRVQLDAAVSKTLGQIRGLPAENRVIPILAARASRQMTSPSNQINFRDWLFSTKPQMVISGGLGELYYVSDEQAHNAGQRYRTYHDDSISLPLVAGYSLPSVSTSVRASAFIFATQRKPYLSAPDNLIPLYRLSMVGACQGRRHVYTSPLIVGSQFSQSALESSGNTCPTSEDPLTIPPLPDPNPIGAKYQQVGIEGFMFATQEPGTVPLRLTYSATDKSFALMTPADANLAEFSGYTNPPSGGTPVVTILGYVYPNDTSGGNGLDTDAWPSGWEIARGLNEQANDGDCDANIVGGGLDNAEYPLAGLPSSDPMSTNTNCTDLRLRQQPFAGGIEYVLTNPVGPSASIGTKVEFDVITSVIAVDPMAAPGTLGPPPAGWECAQSYFNVVDIRYTCLRNFGSSYPVESTTTFVFNFAPPPSYGPAQVRASSSYTDPVPGNNNVN